MAHTLLMVEDNADNADLATWMLEDAGYEVEATEDAESGLELLQSKNYDLVLMDISLPGMDGKDAIRWMRNSEQYRNIPIIALTAHAILNERDAIMESGADSIVTKPIEEDLLLSELSKLLNLN